MAVPAEAAFSSVRTLGQQLRAKQFTSVELTKFFLDRLEKYGPPLNAVVTLTPDLALREAAAADKALADGQDLGPLHGIPYGAKDLLATQGIPTSWGAAPFKDRIIDEDATVITRLRAAGAVLAAKLAMVEIAGGLGYDQADASFTGPGRNPWEPGSWSGGSSSGSGSAVGAGLVPWAIGTETWGSITTPAGYCGVTGLRPTYGRVSRHGAMALSWTMDKIGCLTRTAEDAGLVLGVMAGADPLDASCLTVPYEFNPNERLRKPYRLALLKGESNLQPAVEENFEAALEVLKPHCTLEEIELPEFPYNVVASTIIACEMAAAFEGIVRSGDVWEMAAPEDRIGAHAPQFIPAKDYINAMRIRAKFQKAVDELLAPYDAIITPTLSSVAGPIDSTFDQYHRRWFSTSIGGAANASGIPAVTVPCGFGERGLPTALKLVGRALDENKLIDIARTYQDATDWHTRTPPLDGLVKQEK